MGNLFFQISSKSTNDRNESEGGIATFGMKTMGRRKGNAICIMATGLGGRDWQYNVFLSMTLRMDLVAGGPKESFMEAKALIKHDNNNNVILSVLDDYTFDIHKRLLKCILPFNLISYTDNNEESADLVRVRVRMFRKRFSIFHPMTHNLYLNVKLEYQSPPPIST